MEESTKLINPELDLFVDHPLQVEFEDRKTERISPNSEQYTSTITFEVPNNREQCYLDPSSIRLELTTGIEKHDGTNWINMAKGDKIFPINNFMHSLFKDVTVEMNGTVINQHTNNYPYVAYLNTLLTYNEDYLDTQGASFLWEKDQAGAMDTVDVADDTPRNTRHMRFINDSDVYHTVIMTGRLISELFQQEKFLPYKADLRIKLYPNRDNFVLMGETDDKQRVKIVNAELHVDYVKIDADLYLQYEKKLQSGKNMIIPIRRKIINTYNITKGEYSKTISNPLTDKNLPRRLVLAMTTNQAYNGKATKNPFNFGHFGLTELSISYAGKDYPNKPFKPVFGSDLYMRSYMSIFQGTGALDKNVSLPITYSEYKDGFTIWCFDFTPDQAGDESLKHKVQEGSIDINVRFGTALTQAVTLLCYAEYDNRLEIDFARNVYKDY